MKKNYVFAVITVLVWSTTAALVKKILFDIPNMEVLSISSYAAFVFLLLANVKNGHFKEMKHFSLKDYGVMAGLGFLGLFVYTALYYYGLSQLTSQEACILNYLWPIMLVIFSCIILKEPLTFMKGFAMLCSFMGIVILSTGNVGTSAGNVTLGMISCIIAAACYGLFSVLNKKVNYNQNIAMMIYWLVAGIFSMLLGLKTEVWVPISGVQWLGILWIGVVVDAVAYLLWAIALNDAQNTAIIANMAFLTPFLSVIVSAIFLKEQITLRAIIALVFIIGGILLQNIYEYRQEKKQIICRIKEMEGYFDVLKQTVNANPQKLQSDLTLQAALTKLMQYYDNGEWLKDYQYDEQGKLPQDLKRGVLSEDGVYNLLTEIDFLLGKGVNENENSSY